jgi:antitoxin component YwqK of YwqJK toxin-antitoxin module
VQDAPPLKNGLYVSYYPNGNIKSKETYKNGVKEGHLTRYRPNGKVFIEENYKKGKLDGKQRRLNSCQSYALYFKNGRKSGKARYYDNKGKVTRLELYKPGFGMISYKEFDAGQLSSSFHLDVKSGAKVYERYKNGDLIETIRYDSQGNKIE